MTGTTHERQGLVAMVLATALWGGTFVASRDVLRTVDPVTLIAARFAVAAALFLPVLVMRRARLDRVTLVGGVLAGACAAGGYLFQAIGLTSTSAGSSAFLTCAGTELAAVYAWPLLGQRPGARLTQGLLLALVGSAPVGSRGGLALGRGELWTLAGAAVYAFQIVVLARVAPGRDPLVLAGVQHVVVAAMTLPFAHGVPSLAPGDGLKFAYLVAAGTVAAPLLAVIAQRVLPAGRIALLYALEPVFGLVVALALGGERFAPHWWLGAALILAGVVWVEAPGASGTPGAPGDRVPAT